MARSFTVHALGIPEMRKICSPHLVDGGFPIAGSGTRGGANCFMPTAEVRPQHPLAQLN